MNATVKAGIALGVFVVLWTLFMGITGWYKDPVLLNMFYVVILIQIGVLVWGLRRTAAGGKTYGGQVMAGTTMSAIGAILIFFGSLLFTTVFFPNYFAELREAGRQVMVAQGMTEEQIVASLEAQAPMQTPFMQALIGSVMTVVTGLVASLVLAAFIKRKNVP
jgi:hypothetical protein